MTIVHRRRVFRFPVLVLLAGCVATPSANAMPSSGDLSPRLADLASPSLRSAPAAKQAAALDLATEGPGSLIREGRRVLVYVRFDRGAIAGLDDLRSAGARVVDVSRRYQTVTVTVSPQRLRAVAAVARVASVTEVFAPVSAAAVCPSGSVVSEGDLQLRAADVREGDPALDGAGITVGILSDSFDQAVEVADGSGPVATHATEDVQSADLPGSGNECGHATPVEVLEENKSKAKSTDEGRAMAQIVHDLAPGVDIRFASAFNGVNAYANNIDALVEAGAEVIADDVFYLEEPFFQDGPIAVAVTEAVEDGVAYFSAAGNNNLRDAEGHDIASWETPAFRDGGGCPPEVQEVPLANGAHCLDFHPGSQTDRTFGMKVLPGATLTVDLQWNEPWNGVGTDFDAFLLDAGGNLIAGAGTDNIKASMPIEVLQWQNGSPAQRTVQLVINRYAGTAPRIKFVLVLNGSGVPATEYPRSTGEDVVGPTVFGHSGSAAAISLGAVPFANGSVAEKYSSRGPVTHHFGPVEDTAAAPPLPSPETLSKPDIAATDCGQTTFFATFLAGEGAWRFCGTSAAAPHAAAVSGLMLDAKPLATPEEIRAAMFSSAVGVGGSGPCAVGAGLVEAVGAIEDLLAPPPPVEPNCEPPESEGSPEGAAAAGDWGSEVPPPLGTPAPPASAPAPDGEEGAAPRTFFRQRPRKVIRTRHLRARAVFRFGSDLPGASYACRIDGGLFRPCPERLVRQFGPGWHTLQVAARDQAGHGDQSPATYRFRVKLIG